MKPNMGSWTYWVEWKTELFDFLDERLGKEEAAPIDDFSRNC